MKKVLLGFAFALFSFFSSFSQVELKLKTGTFVNTNPSKNPANEPAGFSNYLFNGRYYLLLQLNQMFTEAEKSSLKASGVELFGYLPEKTFIASFPINYNFNQLQLYKAYAVTKMLPEYKIDLSLIDPSAISWAVENDSIRKVYISFTPVLPRDEVANALYAAGISFTRLPNQEGEELVIKASMNELQKIAAHPLVQYIEPIAAPPVLEDLQGISNHRTNLTFTSDNWATGRKLDGSNVVIAIGDDGAIGPHIDFKGRIAINANNTSAADTHGDHCAGIITGAGNLNPTVRGQAPGATLRSYDSYADFGLFPNIYNLNNVRISSHSLGQTCNSGYNSNARTSDQQVRLYPSMMHVHSAGNSGNDVCGGLTGGWRTITGGYKAGKNVIAVANVTKADLISSSSSKGPLPDGRIKPDVAAVGNSVNSTQPNNTFALNSGTSMACPAVAGTLGVLYQAYKNLNGGNDPNSGLMKAILMNTADDLGNEGPDFTYGFGRVNARRAVECIENGRYFSGISTQGVTNTHSIAIPTNVAYAKVMVYWVDMEATAGANPSLVNNIDATLVSPMNVTNLPWLMFAGTSPTPASCNTPAVRGVDNLNNVEQIQLDDPLAGEYTLRVTGTNIPSGPQTYYVVYQFIYYNEITVTHPYGGESFVPGETQRIRWDGSDPFGTFEVHYSTNGGSSWTQIASSVSGFQRYYDWTVPSINTAQGRIRVSRPGVSSDISDTNFVILGVPIINGINAVCADASNVSWSAVSGATGYDVFKLGDKFMELVASTTATNVNVNGVGGGSEQWIAVRAKMGERMFGRRSNAVSHTNNSGAGCSLPVKLISFSAAKKAANAELTWLTVQEQGIIKYVVERGSTPDFNDVVIVGEVNARNVQSQQQYQLTDRTTGGKGTWFYRLRIVEVSKHSFSKVESLKWDGLVQGITVYPNPVKNNLFVQSQENYGSVDAEFINEMGVKVFAARWNLSSGSANSVDVSKLPSGNYFLVMRESKNGNIISRQKIAVVK